MRVWARRLTTEQAADSTNDVAWLYGRYAASMYRLAMFITGSADDAEDAVADVFARLSAKRNALRPGNDPRPYLLSAVRNASYSIIRKMKRQVDVSDSMLEYLSQAEYSNPVDTHIEAAEIMQRVALLPSEQREVVVLKALEQLTFSEIAELVGQSANTVASRYRSAIAAVRKSLEDGVDETAAD